MPAFSRLAMALLIALRGNIFVYQGQELGLQQDEIPFALLKDPEAIANWPLTLSRDGARTPLPWTPDAPGGGFTDGAPWLPLSPQNLARAVATQTADPGSMLRTTQRLLALRRASAALRTGALTPVVARDQLLIFSRTAAGEAVHCAFNLGTAAIPLPHPLGGTAIFATEGATAATLPPYGAVLTREAA